MKKNIDIFSRTTGLISTQYKAKHIWVKGIEVFTNEGPCTFQNGDSDSFFSFNQHASLYS